MTTRDRLLMILSLLLSLVALTIAATPRTTPGHRVGSYIPGGGGSPGGSANEIQTNNGSSGFAGATNVTAGTSEIAIGASPASAGALRFANATAIEWRNSGGSGDLETVTVNGSDQLILGNAGFLTTILKTDTSGAIYIRPGANDALIANGANILFAKPAIGSTSDSSPYANDGLHDVATGDADHTLTSGEYIYYGIRFTGTDSGATKTMSLPGVAPTDEKGYQKLVIWGGADGNHSLAVTTTDGGGTVTLGNTAGTNNAALIFCDSNGCHLIGSLFGGW